MDQTTKNRRGTMLNLRGLAKPTYIGLAALLVMVAVFAGKHAIDTATASSFEIVAASQESTSPAAEIAEPPTIFIHVSGAVENPGLVELKPNSRVADAVNAAGGFSDTAVADSVNLARTLQDGEQVFIASESDTAPREGANENPSGTGAAQAASATAGASQQAPGKVNINTATADELEALPGIGPSTAEKIVADRQSAGSFGSVEELKRVQGIGDKKFAALADMICV